MATTHFGYQSVDEQDKARRVRGVFDSVASRYDLMNDLMSAGLHRLWKEALLTTLKPPRDRAAVRRVQRFPVRVASLAQRGDEADAGDDDVALTHQLVAP